MKYLIIILILVSLGKSSFCQTLTKQDCSILKSGKFKYIDTEDTSAYFVVKGDRHMEFYENGKYHLKSKMSWIGDCQYSLSVVDFNVPNFPFKVGTVLKGTITQIQHDTIFITSDVNGVKAYGKFKKVEE